MKATVNLLAGVVAVGVGVATSLAWAGPGSAPPAGNKTPAPRGGAASTAAQDAENRAEAAKSLRLADQAIKEGNFKLAEYYLERAEKLNVSYDDVTAKFEITPASIRQRLAQAKAKAGVRPGAGINPAAATRTPPADPFSGRQREPAGDYDVEPRPIPPTDEEVRGQADRLPTPAGGEFGGGEFSAAPIDPREIRQGNPLPPERGSARNPAAERVPGPQGEAFRLAARAREALDRGDLDNARKFAQEADSYGLPNEAYSKELIPWVIMLDIDKAAARRRSVTKPAGYEPEVGAGDPRSKYPVAQGLYEPASDRSRNMAASAQERGAAGGSEGAQLFDAGMRALAAGKRDDAARFFNQAWEHEAELEPRTRQQLQDQINALRAGVVRPQPARAPAPSALEAVDAQQRLLQQKLAREIQAEQSAAEKMRDADPRGALERMKKLRDRIRESALDPQAQKQLLVMADRGVLEIEKYIEINKGKIELDERNRQVRGDIDRDRLRVIEVQNKLAQLVEEFNNLIEQQRYAEAEVIAKQAKEIEPDSAIVQTMLWKSRFVRRIESQMAIRDRAEEGFYRTLESVDESKIPFDDREPIIFGDAKRWNELSASRAKLLQRERSRLSPSEMEIQSKLKSPVRVEFTETPLAVALDTLGKRVGINIVLDPQGLTAEGVTSDAPVTINLTQEISLRSALNLILQPLRLSYVIQNEVLRVTSEQAKDSNVYAVVYNVADLVIPIPNFVPSYNVGLPSALRDAYNSLGYGASAPASGAVPLTFASNETPGTSASVLAQMSSPGMAGAFREQGLRQPRLAGPGGLGGGAQADFDTLIDLITSTIAPTTWDDNGGAGSITGFDTNLSLVVSQTQDVHEQIADLLEQLRRLQDLQVTIEVRFIALQDDFFERIGVDFDFNIKDNTTPGTVQIQTANNVNTILGANPSAIIGLAPPVANQPNPTGTLDLQFTQQGFGSAVPQFGGFDANTAANFGFAILSDIELFLFIQASTGDTRTNIMQAPKVTLFNGQQATISDTSQTPFVTSIIPVVGDFAAAHQPVIVVLSEGTSLSVQAVVSADKRFVRLTLVPFFSKIGDVKEFTFNGRTTTRTGQGVVDPANPNTFFGRNNEERIVEGTTVQLPTFAFTTVTTTVSVPDGGTVLLGGIKRLSEGRNERGVPMLNKVPYVNRLFRNVGIGRTTRSLMMMVTPRIIIQEEEEERSVGRPLTP